MCPCLHLFRVFSDSPRKESCRAEHKVYVWGLETTSAASDQLPVYTYLVTQSLIMTLIRAQHSGLARQTGRASAAPPCAFGSRESNPADRLNHPSLVHSQFCVWHSNYTASIVERAMELVITLGGGLHPLGTHAGRRLVLHNTSQTESE